MSRTCTFRLVLAAVVTTVTLRAIPAYPCGESKSITALAVDPQIPTTLYAATSDERVLKSTDGASTWRATALTSPDAITALAVDPQTGSTVYATSSTYEGSRVFKSTDGGESWVIVSSLRYLSATRLAIGAQTPSRLYMLASGGIYESMDGGATWEQVAIVSQTAWVFDFASVVDFVIDR